MKYYSQLNDTKASFCLISKNHANLVKNKNLNLIISEQPFLDFVIIAKIFYPDATDDFFEFKNGKKFSKYQKLYNSIIDNRTCIKKNFTIGFNSVIKKNVKIGNNVKIGSGSTILPVEIENNVVVGAGSVVTKNLKQNGIYAGNPAKLIRKIK